MNEKVAAYLAAKRAEQTSREGQQIAEMEREQALYRRRVLIKAGLYEKVYTDLNYKTDAYPNYDAHVGKYFAAVTYPVSDEDFEEIARYTPVDDAPKQQNFVKEDIPCKKSLKAILHSNDLSVRVNGLADTMSTIGNVLMWITIICGFIVTIVYTAFIGELDGGVAFITFIVMALFFGLSAFLTKFLFDVAAAMLYSQAAIVQNTKIAADAATYALWKEENKDPTEK